MAALFTAPTDRDGVRRPIDPRHHRPLVLFSSLAGLIAAGGVLLVLAAVGVIGWFVTDAGVHGAPRDGLRVASLAWLAAHGAGFSVRGTEITIMPLGISAACAWTCWRLGYRVGDSVSGHGPDADGIVNGERDWTVPMAASLFSAAYVVVAMLAGALAATATSAPSMSRAFLGALVLSLGVGGAGIAAGSGRAAIWFAAFGASQASFAGPVLHGARRILVTYLWVAALALAISFSLDLSKAATITSRLRADAGDTALFVLAIALVIPNAVAFSGSYLLGPGFALGTKTVVSPALVVLGPLPLVPLVAALPESGTGTTLTKSIVAIPIVVAAYAAARTHRRYPTTDWLDSALRGGGAGVVAGTVFALVAWLSGGVAGPGRLRQVEPYVFDVLTHAIAYFGIGGVIGALAMTWWVRRAQAR